MTISSIARIDLSQTFDVITLLRNEVKLCEPRVWYLVRVVNQMRCIVEEQWIAIFQWRPWRRSGICAQSCMQVLLEKHFLVRCSIETIRRPPVEPQIHLRFRAAVSF